MFVREEDTICYKINRCQEDLENLVKTGKMDVLKILKRLEEMRNDAQRMEISIRTNKTLRLKYGYDDEYRKMMNEETVPPEENQLPVGNSYTPETPDYEVWVKDNTGKQVYHQKSHAFIMAVVEEIKDIDAAGIIDGRVQVFSVGHDISLFFAFDQWNQKMKSKMVEIQLAMAEAIRSKRFMNKEWKSKMLKFLNK